MVVTPAALGKYNQVFGLLLAIQHAQWALGTLRVAKVSSTDPAISVATLLHVRMLFVHVVAGLHAHVLLRILAGGAHEFLAAVAAARDLDQVRTLHAAFLESVLDRCMLHPTV